MAGVMSPTISSGIMNDRKLPNSELNVAKIRANQTGANSPTIIPRIMAITTLPSRGILESFIQYKSKSSAKATNFGLLTTRKS